ncbi:MAG: baseplate J/gp47 family protein [Bacteroidetes bacterium]|nr:baseplate J/gp47 family protein [Bacteroidota bacterium]
MNCKALIHPFQNDAGTSQSQRVMEDLLDGPAQLDGRTMADMLGYFVKFSRQINFYDVGPNNSLIKKDWQPFFQNSLPFLNAAILNFRQDAITAQIATYQKKFLRRPTKAGLDILVNYLCTKILRPFNTWDQKLNNSGLPIEIVLDGLIKKGLRDNLKAFIIDLNTAVKFCHITPVDLSAFLQTETTGNPWNLTTADLSTTQTKKEFKKLGPTKRARLIALYKAIASISTPFLKAINASTGAAGISLQQSFESLRDDLKQRHQPHLALIFAFLNLFRHLQDSLNTYTKKHVDFFYRQVLAFQPKGAIPDKAHIVFSIQKQLTSYRLEKGTLLKGPKDVNKSDILFGLDDEIVVNQAQVTDLRTLYVNNQSAGNDLYVQGVYMAPVATMSDGIDKPFPDSPLNSWPTLGARYSKYTDPTNNTIRPYPNARLALVLASPVLLLNEGTRNITITLTCTLKSKHCTNNLIHDPATLSGDIQSALQTQQGLSIAFSGDKDWITPTANPTITLSDFTAAGDDHTFKLTIDSKLQLEEPPVTFYNKDVLKEDIDTQLPAARITLNDNVKIKITPSAPTTDATTPGAPAADANCCIRPASDHPIEVSLYHFFRDVVINDTNITVQVCGLKKFIVQNDESIQDVSKPIYPFGTRPTIIDFDIVTAVQPNPPSGPVIESAPVPAAPTPVTPAKNLVGPNFYIGSQEVFNKKWTDLHVNLNWKDKPSNFREYYRAYWADNNNPGNFGLDENAFEINIAVLQKQGWLSEQENTPHTTQNTTTQFNNRKLFENNRDEAPKTCSTADYQQTIAITNTNFEKDYAKSQAFHIDPSTPLTKYDASTQYGFIRLNLQNQDFLQKDYAYVLARQMMALSKISGQTGDKKNADDLKIENAVYYNKAGEPIVFSTNQIRNNVGDIKNILEDIKKRVDHNLYGHVDPTTDEDITDQDAREVRGGLYRRYTDDNNPVPGLNLQDEVNKIQGDNSSTQDMIDNTQAFQAIIPNEPWTPIIQGMSLDYTAVATITDINLIHLYPFSGTYKKEELSQSPTLFPSFCDEGTLFLGLTALVPGSDVNILFQLAEATSDTEEDPEPLQWSYLDENVWKPLRTGFEILDDKTNDLSTSGIIKFAIPGNINTENTVMPSGLSWIRASIPGNSGIVAETIAVYTQAIEATFTDAATNDTERLDTPLLSNSLTKLNTADANIKKVDQPYDSFGGRVAETDGYFYVRVSETLRHKGRAIQSTDYERIALDAFPQVFKAKCIPHSLGLNAHKYANDYPMAPGYVLLAVIPDLNQLKAPASFEPRVPLSMLEAIEDKMRQLTSPFVRFRAMNPRYEKVDFSIQVKLLPDKDETFYKQKLQDDIREFMAPWSVGQFDKLRFGQVINRSDVIRFLETRDYIDYIIDWKWRHDEDETIKAPSGQAEIFPLTPRSILFAGTIDVTIVHTDCPQWDTTPANNTHKIKIYKNGQLPGL